MAAGEVLEWDTEFFGYTTARIDPLSLKNGGGDQLEGWLRLVRPKCVYLLWDDTEGDVNTFSTINFERINTRIELVVEAPFGLRSRNSDILIDPPAKLLPQVASLSAEIFLDSRFYRDARFGSEKASELFAIWASNSFQGENTKIFYKPGENSRVDGFLVLASNGQNAVIELLGVDGELRGKGIGRTLVSSALDHARKEGINCVTVVTQYENYGAVKLYKDMGFDVIDSRTWYHAWFEWAE